MAQKITAARKDRELPKAAAAPKLARLPKIKVPRAVQYALAGISALAFANYLFQNYARSRDRRKFPAQGSMVEVGGFRLHMVAAGRGAPVVVLDSGSGGYSLDWQKVQPEIARVTRVVSYDRAGHGWSEAGNRPHSIPNVVQDLHTLLQSSGQKAPYVLVGHSLGGVYAHYFARRYPGEVAGVVLVDAVHPEIYNYLPQDYQRKTQFELSKRWLAATSGLMRLGVLRLPSEGELNRQRSALAMQPSLWRTALDQNRHLRPGGERLFEEAGPFPDVPLVVLVPSNTDWLAAIHPDLPKRWLEGQQKLVELSPQGRLVVIENAGHDLLEDNPEVVTQAVLEVVEQIRNGT